jgi:hypothetical protein
MGQILTPRSAPACLLPLNADIAILAGRAAPKERASATGQRFGDCFDEYVVQGGYALTLPQYCDDDAKSAFASCGHAAALALGSNVPRADIRLEEERNHE